MRSQSFWLGVLTVVALFAAACGDSDATSDETDVSATSASSSTPSSPDDDGSGGDDGAGDEDTSDDEGSSSSPTEGTDDSATESADESEGDGPDDEDAAEIVGNEDLDLEELPEDAAEALDDIDDIVSIGDCQSDTLGIAVVAPDMYMCRVLDQSIAGVDGFTVFTEGNQLNITIGTPSPISACEVLLACDSAVPVDLSDQWPDTQQFEIAGTVTIWGRHATVDAEVVITKFTALTDDELALVRSVLDSTMEVG